MPARNESEIKHVQSVTMAGRLERLYACDLFAGDQHLAPQQQAGSDTKNPSLRRNSFSPHGATGLEGGAWDFQPNQPAFDCETSKRPREPD